MESKRKYKPRVPAQSLGNLALDNKDSWGFESPKSIHLSLVPAPREDSFDQDGLAPAKGLVWGIVLSIVLWCFIILSIYAVV